MKITKPIVAAISIAMLTGNAYADLSGLPRAGKGDGLTSRGIYSLKGIDTYDNANGTAVFVGPESDRNISGQYYTLGSTTGSCESYLNREDLLYYVPPKDQFSKLMKGTEFISTYFSIARMSYRLEEIQEAALASIKELDEISKNNSTVIEDYLTFSEMRTDLNVKLSSLKGRESVINDEFNSEQTTCLSLYLNKPRELSTCIQDAIAKKTKSLDGIQEEIVSLNKALVETDQKYYPTLGKYKAYKEKRQIVIDSINQNQGIIKATTSLLTNNHEKETKAFTAAGTEIVGVANVGYSLFSGDEVSKVSNVLIAKGHNLKVSKLNIFNVRLNTGISKTNPKISYGDRKNTLYDLNVISVPANTRVSSDFEEEFGFNFKSDSNENITFAGLGEASFRSGSYETFVVKSVACGRPSVEEIQRVVVDNGTESKPYTFTKTITRPYHTTVLSVPVSLSYNFYTDPGPIRASCKMNISKSDDYHRNKGRSTKIGFFSTKKKSWDDTRREYFENMGLVCDSIVPPVSLSPKESREYGEEIEKKVMSDVYKSYLSTFAKSYDVTIVDNIQIDDPEKSKKYSALGTGILSICPFNLYCQIGNIVLKSLDELGGGRNEGSTSAKNSFDGSFTKTYNRHTFGIQEGAAILNLKVCLSESNC